jgi:hypothetical protein
MSGVTTRAGAIHGASTRPTRSQTLSLFQRVAEARCPVLSNAPRAGVQSNLARIGFQLALLSLLSMRRTRMLMRAQEIYRGYLLVAVLAATAARPAAALSTAFTFQGQLQQSGMPQNGTCDFQFSLWDAISGGSQIGGTLSLSAVTVTNALFTVSLDFGAGAFAGSDRFLQPSARCPAGSGSYTVFPRQQLMATPYALYAPAAGSANGLSCSGCVTAGALASGSIGSAQILAGSIAPADLGFNYAASTSKGGAATDLACSACIVASEISSGQVVKSLNGLTDGVTLAQGSNVTIAPSSRNTLTIASNALPSVMHDPTLAGNGTAGTPLGVALPLTLNGNVSINGDASVVSCGDRLKLYGSGEWITEPCGDLNYPIAFFGDFTERMRINNNGNVGIGTNNPGETLDVNGSVRVRSLAGCSFGGTIQVDSTGVFTKNCIVASTTNSTSKVASSKTRPTTDSLGRRVRALEEDNADLREQIRRLRQLVEAMQVNNKIEALNRVCEGNFCASSW